MSDKCTYEVYTEKSEQIESHPCGKKVVIVFSKDGRAFPRCTKHASDKTRNWASQHGYETREA